MEKTHYTIGMAGHIDHGKTSLTKALTDVDTDRLKEEKARNISIEPGFAPLTMEGTNLQISVIDVPGHERFIRQMIAGVAGIDLVILVIAADEGIMPQTKEHMDILSLLNIHNGIIVLTKIDKAGEELTHLVREDIIHTIKESPFRNSPILEVDSLSRKGIKELKNTIARKLTQTPSRAKHTPFRMPIDQVFTLNGIGTIARGTIYDGFIRVEESAVILPKLLPTRIRQLQVHSENVKESFAGQRTAVQLVGLHKDDIVRGDVLVKQPELFTTTKQIDVSLKIVIGMKADIKQRSPIKLHTGSSEVYGQIVFFDRNVLKTNNGTELLCQLRLQNEIVVKKGDRFILRRATPMETIGGGEIINPKGEKYKFGVETINRLKALQQGSPKENIIQLLTDKSWLTRKDLVRELNADEKTLQRWLKELEQGQEITCIEGYYCTKHTYDNLLQGIKSQLVEFHEAYPMRPGMNKPELTKNIFLPKLVLDSLLKKWISVQELKQKGPYISIFTFKPHMPSNWQKRMENILIRLQKDGLVLEEWDAYLLSEKIPKKIAEEWLHYLLDQQIVYSLMDKYVIHSDSIRHLAEILRGNTPTRFTVKEAKEVLNSSRKYIIPLLELFDEISLTKRVENYRVWIQDMDNGGD